METVDNPTMEEMVLVGEAANQGYRGLFAVACVLRTRGYNLNGFSAKRRSDLARFYQAQPAKVKRFAAKALREVRAGAADITFGATHYENTESFMEPWWGKSTQKTTRILDHQFYREKGFK